MRVVGEAHAQRVAITYFIDSGSGRLKDINDVVRGSATAGSGGAGLRHEVERSASPLFHTVVDGVHILRSNGHGEQVGCPGGVRIYRIWSARRGSGLPLDDEVPYRFFVHWHVEIAIVLKLLRLPFVQTRLRRTGRSRHAGATDGQCEVFPVDVIGHYLLIIERSIDLHTLGRLAQIGDGVRRTEGVAVLNCVGVGVAGAPLQRDAYVGLRAIAGATEVDLKIVVVQVGIADAVGDNVLNVGVGADGTGVRSAGPSAQVGCGHEEVVLLIEDFHPRVRTECGVDGVFVLVAVARRRERSCQNHSVVGTQFTSKEWVDLQIVEVRHVCVIQSEGVRKLQSERRSRDSRLMVQPTHCACCADAIHHGGWADEITDGLALHRHNFYRFLPRVGLLWK